MSAADHRIHDLLRRYLSGEITAPEEAELERRARQDEALAAAMRGLRAFPEEDHAARVRSMLAGAGERRAPAATAVAPLRRPNWWRWSIAAGFLLVLAVVAFLLPRTFDEPGDAVAMETTPPQKEDYAESTPTAAAPEEDSEAMPESPAPAPSARDPHPVASEPSSDKAKAPPMARTQTDVPAEGDTGQSPSALPQPTTASPPAAPLPPPPPPGPPEEVAAEAEPELADEALAIPVSPVEEAAAPESFRMLQTGQFLRGRVTTVNGSPVAGALVRIPGLPLGERSDTNGAFRIQIDETISRLQIAHPEYEDEEVEVPGAGEALQVSLSPEERESGHDWAMDAAKTKIELDQGPGYARPQEGYGNLRERLETNRPPGIPAGKVRLSFLVNLDGSLTDFRFRGRPDSLMMEYVGRTLVETSSWNVVKGEEPVRVHFKLRFE